MVIDSVLTAVLRGDSQALLQALAAGGAVDVPVTKAAWRCSMLCTRRASICFPAAGCRSGRYGAGSRWLDSLALRGGCAGPSLQYASVSRSLRKQGMAGTRPTLAPGRRKQGFAEQA